jgi:glycerol-3-phosphate dehydrogenase (NAD(P)+)
LLNNSKKIAVLGAGGWGTSLALVLCDNGYNVTLWSHDKELVESINANRINSDFLPGIIIPENLSVSSDNDVLNECNWFVNAIPTQYIHNAIEKYEIPVKNKYIINGSKGIDINSLSRISELFISAGADEDKFAVLTGPSHAEEVSRKTPTTIVCASVNKTFVNDVQRAFSNEYFRVYSSEDVIGCELGGSLKNVIALAAGIIDGLGLGDNTKAALITRGLAEISRLGVAMGGKSITFSGLSGLGDLFVTCNSKHSRNRRVGERIGAGASLEEVTSEMKMVAEGVYTTQAAIKLGKKYDVEMPITEKVYEILFENIKPLDAIRGLMSRESKSEWWW